MTGGLLPELGFIGVGLMGGPMTLNLLEAGYPVTVHDIRPERVSACVDMGATAGADAAAVVRACPVVLTSLPSSPIWVEVAESILVPNAREGQIFIDLGTVIPYHVRRIAALLADKGACLLDAPVSGGTWGAQQGMLRMFVGGDQSALDRCVSLLEVLAAPERIVYCGPSGSGQVVKGVNQLAMGLGYAAYIEAMAFGVRSGVDPAAIDRAIGGGEPWREHFSRVSGQVVDGYGEQVVVMHPQLAYFIAEAAKQGFDLPLTERLQQIMDHGEMVVPNKRGDPSPSYWHEMMRRGRGEGV